MGMVFQSFNLFPPHDRAGERGRRSGTRSQN
jgi:hypothetical protein